MKLKYKVGLYSVVNLLLIIIISAIITGLFIKTRNEYEAINSINRMLTHLFQDRENLKRMMLANDAKSFNDSREIVRERSQEFQKYYVYITSNPQIKQTFSKIQNHESILLTQKSNILKLQDAFDKTLLKLNHIGEKIKGFAEISNTPEEMLRYQKLMHDGTQALYQHKDRNHLRAWLRFADSFYSSTNNVKIKHLLKKYKVFGKELTNVVRRLVAEERRNKRTFLQYELLLARLDESISSIEQEAGNSLLEQLSFLRKFAVAASVIFILISVFFSMMLHFMIVNPIHKLTNNANEVAKGDFTVTNDINGKDEIGELASHFNSMTASLKELYENMDEKIKEKTQELEDINRKLHAESEQRMALAKMFEMQACTDSLTKCMNRRAAEEYLKKEVSRANRHETDLTICYIDLDNLKVANDNYGHKEGDYMICTFVEKVNGCLRAEDMLCRMGGDEFMIICPGCNFNGVRTICQRINEKLAVENSTNDKGYNIEFSWGALPYERDVHSSVDKYIDIADQIMYENKMRKKKMRAEAGITV